MKAEIDYETRLVRLKVWMDRMGLREYVPLFKLHKVDDEVLQFLTVEDLKDMGVTKVGSRLKIYQYIQKFCKQFS